MELVKTETSFVIVGLQHNPTILLSDFLMTSNIIDDLDEIDSGNSFVTPAIADVTLIDKTNINITPERLIIKSNIDNSPFEMGLKYSKALPYISYQALGINFKYRVSDVGIDKFINLDESKFMNESLKIKFEHEQGACFVTLKQNKSKNHVEVDFNFDYKVEELVKIGSMHIDVVKEGEKNYKKTKEIINELF
ncbi:MAG: hypothetical protein JXR20_02835 [Balneola sp.]